MLVLLSEFDSRSRRPAGHAVLSANCSRVRCPRCGYEIRPPTPAPSADGGADGGLVRRRGSRRCPDGLTLQELGPGRGTVLRLLDLEHGPLAQRDGPEVLPGVQVESGALFPCRGLPDRAQPVCGR
jgi:hypothetical protein